MGGVPLLPSFRLACMILKHPKASEVEPEHRNYWKKVQSPAKRAEKDQGHCIANPNTAL